MSRKLDDSAVLVGPRPKRFNTYVGRAGIPLKHVEVMLQFVPGAEDFLLRFWDYVQEIPCDDGQALVFERSLMAGYDAVYALGMTPVTVDVHELGLRLLVRSVLDSACAELAAHEWSTGTGVRWTPFVGPLSGQPEGTRMVRIGRVEKLPSGDADQAKVLRTMFLSHCLTGPQLLCLAECWSDVID